MSRPGRPGQSCACGALIKATNEIKSEGLTCNCKIPGGEPQGPTACWPILMRLACCCVAAWHILVGSAAHTAAATHPLHLQCMMLWTQR